ncbi:MAG: ligase-associated DNA damage response endonuclease PdeM [Hyphomicrobiaceae bacterium]
MTFEARSMQVGQAEVMADRSGALYLPAERTLIVADLHLEKGSAFAARGIMLPPYDTRETLRRLADVLSRYRPVCVIALGDSFHDAGARERLPPDEATELRRLQARQDWIWITGNHDPQVSPCLGGEVRESLELGRLTLRHEPSQAPSRGEIAGHLHPAARVALKGTGLRRPCFVGNGDRLVMPAFGAFTGGLNVLDEAFAPLFPEARVEIHVLGSNGVYPVAPSSLCPD